MAELTVSTRNQNHPPKLDALASERLRIDKPTSDFPAAGMSMVTNFLEGMGKAFAKLAEDLNPFMTALTGVMNDLRRDPFWNAYLDEVERSDNPPTPSEFLAALPETNPVLWASIQSDDYKMEE